MKLFTKSAFKVALTCPTSLYYYGDERYANQNAENEFLASLAEGGFQVGELAKIYCDVLPENDLSELAGYQVPVERTAELLRQDRVNVAEAAFRFENLFVRADVIRKDGNRLDLIEVKAKSWNPETDVFVKTEKKSGRLVVAGDIQMYVYDVAFQKYVVENALREMGIPCEVHAYLMMADKSKIAETDGINQCFRISHKGGRVRVERTAEAVELRSSPPVLTAFDVDDVCAAIYEGSTAERDWLMGGHDFAEFVREKAAWYCNHERHSCDLKPGCYRCPFFATEATAGLLDGYRECWKERAGFTDGDFVRPLLKDLWGGGNTRQRAALFNRGKYFLDGIGVEDIGTPSKPNSKPGLDYCQRKLLQIAMATGRPELIRALSSNLRPSGAYLDVLGLRAEMAEWRYPLHMIDFETTAVALPFYAGMRPYEQVAFQFSHHVIERIDGDYRIRHAGQYINTKKGKFPNFEFVRALKSELEHDAGTVFRYATHENSILNAIRGQLQEGNEPDKAELIAFIETITHRREGGKLIVGSRDMVDLCDVVKRFYYHPAMKGSNSIKVVLPAVLNTSKRIREKYSKPIYGSEIPSLNIKPENAVAWIVRADDGTVENPYKKLPDVSMYLPDGLLKDRTDEEDDNGFTVNNGGAALTAYSMLQFADGRMSDALKEALLRYCELDTMAMVFIWEYFNECVG